MRNKAMMMIALSLSLWGCAPYNKDTQMTLSHSKSIQTIALHPSVLLKVDKIWPLKGKGSYLQNIKTIIKDEEHVLTVHVSLDAQQLEFIAFNDMIGRLYHLVWTPTSISWQASEHLPSTLLPENILGDFLLVHLTTPELNQCLQGAYVIDNGNERLIQNHQGVIRKIHRSQSIGSLWQKVTIHNPDVGYTLEIQTVPAQ